MVTDNSIKLIHEENVDIVIIQGPYSMYNRIAGIDKMFKIYNFGEERIRASLAIASNQVSATLIRQLLEIVKKITNRAGALMAIDSNCRSTVWHNKVINLIRRGKL